MTVNKCISASGFNYAVAVARNQGATFVVIDRNQGNEALPTGVMNLRTNPTYGGWALGSGTVIDVTGSLIFSSEVRGGALKEVTIVNRGTNNVYVGYNNKIIGVSSGMELQPNESYEIQEGIVNYVWAVTATGVTTLTGGGIFNFNPNTI